MDAIANIARHSIYSRPASLSQLNHFRLFFCVLIVLTRTISIARKQDSKCKHYGVHHNEVHTPCKHVNNSKLKSSVGWFRDCHIVQQSFTDRVMHWPVWNCGAPFAPSSDCLLIHFSTISEHSRNISKNKRVVHENTLWTSELPNITWRGLI